MDDVAVAFQDHTAFEYDAKVGEARTTATPFEVRARAESEDESASEGEQEWSFTVTVVVPTLSAAVEEDVGDAVESGWSDTFERRVADAYDVTRTTGAAGVEGTTTEGDPAVRVRLTFTAPARQGVADAAALVNFVEGTYLQGTIPGYTYRDPVAGLLSAARQRGQGESPSDE